MGIFSDAQGQLTPQSVVQSGQYSNSFEAHMHVIIACKYEKDLMKNSREKVGHRFLHYNPTGTFCCHGNQSSDPILPKHNAAFRPTQLCFR